MNLAALYTRIDFANSRQPRASERSDVFLRSADCQRRAHCIPSADLLNQRRAFAYYLPESTLKKLFATSPSYIHEGETCSQINEIVYDG